jgi:hypothetical protein
MKDQDVFTVDDHALGRDLPHTPPLPVKDQYLSLLGNADTGMAVKGLFI